MNMGCRPPLRAVFCNKKAKYGIVSRIYKANIEVIRLLQKFLPRLQVDSIYDIPLADLWNNGIRGIITDLDNTLVGAKVPLATPELILWLAQVKEMGFELVIVSNNDKLRVSRFAEPLQLRFIHRAKKPTNFAFRKALEWLKLSANQTVVIGDQMLTDVLGGNRMGLHTILVMPIAAADEGFFTKINRKIEKVLLALMKK
ncbi:MAG: family phosphatase [Bacilli bacterium]|nr:family phosphatase [Bacilli bacterium]